MTYNVFSGTLDLTQPINLLLSDELVLFISVSLSSVTNKHFFTTLLMFLL